MTAPVVVVGGGPAGAAAARALCAAGCPVLLLEKGGPSRDKACGDALLPGALSELAHFGLDEAALRAVGGATTQAIALERGGRPLWQIGFPDTTPWVVRRRALDRLLRESALPTRNILYGAAAMGITLSPDGPVVTIRIGGKIESLRASAVVLATGASAGLARMFGIDGAPEGAISVTAYADGPEERYLVFDLSADVRPGYNWRFPAAGGGLNLGICIMRHGHGLIRTAARVAFLKNNGVTQAEPWRGGIGWLWSGRGRRWHHPAGILSAGDAAGLVDPITGEGIGPAFASGRMAGEALIAYLSDPRRPTEALAAYSRKLSAHFDAIYASSALRNTWSALIAA
jgi:flavin-dependent dehydrogenase